MHAAINRFHFEFSTLFDIIMVPYLGPKKEKNKMRKEGKQAKRVKAGRFQFCCHLTHAFRSEVDFIWYDGWRHRAE